MDDVRDEPAIKVTQLCKQFGHVVALDGIDLEVPRGSVFGYLGPNGAGKTTSLRIMLGLIHATSGTVSLLGQDPAREGVAALGGVAGFVESPMFYPYLTGRRNLHLLADLDGGQHHERVEDVLGIVELDGRGNDKVGGYSQGMRQRLGLAAALLRRPQLLLLDEPTNGLDPGGMRDMRRLIGDLAADGLTVLLSSHLMIEVEQLCTELAIIARGRIQFAGTIADLRESHRGFDYRIAVTDPGKAQTLCAHVSDVSVVLGDAGELLVRADAEACARLTVLLGQAGVGIYSMLPDAPSLEELFFDLTETPGRGQESAA